MHFTKYDEREAALEIHSPSSIMGLRARKGKGLGMRLLAISVAAIFVLGSLGCGQANSPIEEQEKREGAERMRQEEWVKENAPATPPAQPTPEVQLGETFEQKNEAEYTVTTWTVESAQIQESRKIAKEYGGGVAEGPLLVLEIRYENHSSEHLQVDESHFKVYTSVTSHNPSLEGGKWNMTYGYGPEGEWNDFAGEVAPGASLEGLSIVKLQPGEEPRYVEIFSGMAPVGSASATASGMAGWGGTPLVRVNLEGVA